MLDGGSSSSGNATDIIARSLVDLHQRYDEIDLDADCRESPLFPIPGEIYHRGNGRFSRPEPQSTDELNALKARLHQMQKRFLPSLQQQLADILESLAPIGIREGTEPERIDTLSIISGLGNTLEEISNFLNSIAVIVVNRLSDPHERDHDYEGLKKYRWMSPSDKGNEPVDALSYLEINRPPSPLRTPRLKEFFDRWSMKSDFRILQDTWEEYAHDLTSTLKELNERIEQENQWGRECDESDKDPLDRSSLGTPEDTHSQGKFAETKQPRTGSLDGNGDILPVTRSSGEDVDNELGASFSTGLSEDPTLRPQLINLAKSTIPLLKLIRIFFNKLSNTQAPFTIGTKLSSAEIDSIEQETSQCICDTENILNILCYMYDCDDFRDDFMDDLKDVKQLRDNARRRFDSSIISLCFYLVPLNPRGELPASGSHYKTWFLTLREQVSLADEKFRNAIYDFETEMKM
ncbi:hypothetical protein PSTG_16171 [Puccinia striiformis f. sp. tritici PST-78]|uniref:Uncharacterized protein n=1 Tax=Puccinia striiformis f. sp. tritici PST-78 TaxID=1165861 RepID=A0A0L0UTJ5_9BASI|nr:hypothetical protein PSTG_16171 [Puccinia striiformis f. sp. tritici PST-78]